MLDRLTPTDLLADEWLASRGVRWRWPRRQGGQIAPKIAPAAADTTDPARWVEAREELNQVLKSAEKDGLVAGVLDAPASVSTGELARMLGTTRRAAQIHMRWVVEAEDAGQMVLPGLPAAAEVYATSGGAA